MLQSHGLLPHLPHHHHHPRLPPRLPHLLLQLRPCCLIRLQTLPYLFRPFHRSQVRSARHIHNMVLSHVRHTVYIHLLMSLAHLPLPPSHHYTTHICLLGHHIVCPTSAPPFLVFIA
ncbi:hypothetical protein JB92DRAFT_1390129 [Gautieria morchelliformis]|nr:hypothetical protein JB92DRAFT_1390129 [Gautieria morchelliformis]